MSSAVASLLQPAFSKAQSLLTQDRDFQASAKDETIKFGIKSSDSDDLVLASINKGEVSFSKGVQDDATFTLSARPDDWTKFFQSPPPRLFQSYWGLLRQFHGSQEVTVLGDTGAFSRSARLWRIVLDQFRIDLSSSIPDPVSTASVPSSLPEESTITGRYTRLSLPLTGDCSIFYEKSGHGPLHLLLLHTAGADSRQWHAIMNNPSLHPLYTMTAFDLPAHGRSTLGTTQTIDAFTLTESEYIACISSLIDKLNLPRPILIGASMAGQICVAAAIHASLPTKSLSISGSIPLSACAHIPFTQPFYETTSAQSNTLNPERVVGMCSPTTPKSNRDLIWWIYSSNGSGVFTGDLTFYFNGWDGRAGLKNIDTRKCPVYMLTGEYDYSCTAEMSLETAEKIQGAKFERMQGLGHFPMTEDPESFVPYLLKAVEWIQSEAGERL